jgi:acyl carrier protein
MADVITLDSIERQLCGEIQTLRGLATGSVKPENTLPSLGMDSLKLVSLLLVIEQRFGVNLMKTGMKPDDMKSVRTLAAAVMAGTAKQPGGLGSKA